jgi:Ca-activated chloride channel family protein
MMRLGAGIVLFVTAAAVMAAQQPPVFRAATQTVSLFATVTDATGRLIPQLAKEDFEILDNNKPQTVTLFVNDIQFIKVVVLLDESGSMVNNLGRVKDGAEQFLLRLLPQDRARIGSFEDKITLSPEFTNDRDALIRFLQEKLQYGNGTRLWDAVDAGMSELSGLEGRRVVLVFTDGDDTASKIGLSHVMDHARTKDVMVYAIGLVNEYFNGQQRVRSQPDRGLKKLAEDTGGGYFELKRTADLGETFTRVAEELHSQYVLGFSPETFDGKVHKLDVRVKKAGMIARARKTYVATRTESAK